MRRPLHHICGLMRKRNARTIIHHTHLEDEPYFPHKYPAVRRELEHLRGQCPEKRYAASQVTFLSKPKRKFRCIADLTDADVLGTCVLITEQERDGIGYIFEAVIPFPEASGGEFNSSYFHVGSRTDIIVAGGAFEISAAYFCQQNYVTTACAQACLKMLLWQSGASEYQPATAEINGVVKRLRRSRRDKTSLLDGLRVREIEAVLNRFDAKALSLDCVAKPNCNPYEFAYLLVESGIPTMVAFQVGKESLHVMPIFGHTLNSDEWLPIATGVHESFINYERYSGIHDYVATSTWAPRLYAHDDMLGPYLTLDPSTVTKDTLPAKDLLGRVRYVFGVVPAKSKIQDAPYTVQTTASRYFWSLVDAEIDFIHRTWRRRLRREPMTEDTLILRTQLITRTAYLSELRNNSDHLEQKCTDDQAIFGRIKRRLPRVFWMTEFTLPPLFSMNKTKLGEILFSLDHCSQMAKGDMTRAGPPPLGFRFIDHLDLFDRDPWSPGSCSVNLGFASHTPLFASPQVGLPAIA